jgi:hypothetical protein
MSDISIDNSIDINTNNIYNEKYKKNINKKH